MKSIPGRAHTRTGIATVTATALAIALLVGGCASDESTNAATGCEGETSVEGQVVTVWASLSGNQADTFERLAFDAEGDIGVEVDLTFMEPGELVRRLLDVEDPAEMPDLVQVPDFAVGAVLDAAVLDPVQTCLDHSTIDTDDFLPGTLENSRLGGVQWGMPLGWNGLLLAYDRNDLEAAGLSTEPPRTLAELTRMAGAIQSGPGPATPVVGSLQLFDLLGAAGAPIVDRDDGRAGPPTRTLIGEPDGVAVFEWADDLVEKGLLDVLDADDPFAGPFAIAENRGTFTFVDARDLWQIGQAVRQGQAPDVEFTLAAIPGVTGPGLLVSGDHFFLGRTLVPQRTAAAWMVLAHLTDTRSQATWHTGADPFPARLSAADDAEVQDLWETVPLLAQGWQVVRSSGESGHVRPRPLIAPTATFYAAMAGLEAAFTPGGSPTVIDILPTVITDAERALTAYRRDPSAYRACALIAPQPSCS